MLSASGNVDDDTTRERWWDKRTGEGKWEDKRTEDGDKNTGGGEIGDRRGCGQKKAFVHIR